MKGRLYRADETIVGVKLVDDEDTVTSLRVKLLENDREVGAEWR